MITKHLGWVPDLPDHRDLPYAAVLPHAKLPAKAKLRTSKFNPPIWDQGDLGSCTAHGIGRIFNFAQRKQGLKGFMPSRLFIYYMERLMEHTVNSDSGAMIRDGMKALAKQGVPPETMWRYDIGRFKERPPQPAFDAAMLNQAIEYKRIPRSLTAMKSCIASGCPFTYGFTVYDSFDAIGPDGMVPMPSLREGILGGHCVTAMDYDDEIQCFAFANSWTAQWGQKGYGWMPYAYFMDENLSDDFWTLTLVEKGK